MDWDDLRYVLALSRTGSLSGAATTLGVARTTVGRRVQALEESLGVRLFDQTPAGFVVTGAGQDLAETANAIESEVLAVEGRVLGRDAELQGPLRVATMDIMYDAFPDVFSSFLERYPGVDLTICASYEEVSLRRREADVAIRMSNAPSDSLVGRRLGTITIALYGSRELVARMGPDAPLDAFPWVRMDERRDDGALDAWYRQHVPHARIAMRYDSYPVLRRAVIEGVGVHFLPCVDGDREESLVRIPGGALPEEGRALWVLTLPDLRTNSRVRAFMDHVYETLRPRL
ncbi:MAG: LysR family transcriptional regulator [Myxococcota bacterium]